MALTINLEVVSVEGSLFSGKVSKVFAPGEMGDLGILPRHTQLLTTLKAGQLRYVTEEGEMSILVAGGVMEVQPTMVTVLVDIALSTDHTAAVKTSD